ncbi:Clp protease N-terminal domain-containing protein [Solwaraspora sp. WMMB335]|uniref:Clp protease N-terminal domain-containing protein n=1 Tax=Solwaraspora sp. WMMB335 TaxID=3404118 RepID=UPI003B92A9FD
MAESVQIDIPVRLDDLITGIKRAHDDSLEQLTSAVVIAEHLDELADHLVGHFVDQARRSGASWSDIGRSMGVTKQAAQKRFVPKTPDEPNDLDPKQGFSRFTPHARNVVVAAQAHARAAGNDEICTAHLLLGLLDDPATLAVRAILAQGPDLDQVRTQASAAVPPAVDHVPDLIPFDAHVRKVLELAFREALRLADRTVDTEHVLLALLEFAVDAGPLADLGITKRAVETYVRASSGSARTERD